jgi:rhamnose transport system substrate-binding protein
MFVSVIAALALQIVGAAARGVGCGVPLRYGPAPFTGGPASNLRQSGRPVEARYSELEKESGSLFRYPARRWCPGAAIGACFGLAKATPSCIESARWCVTHLMDIISETPVAGRIFAMTTTRRNLFKLAGGAAFVAAAPAILTTPLRAAGNKRIAMIVKNLGNSYFDACANGAKEAAGEIGGIDIIYTASAKPTAEDQIAVIDAQIAQKVDGIIVSANDANALVPVGKKAMQRGIKVMSFDSAIAPAGRLVHLSASSTPLIGAKQVQMIGKTLNYKGEVAILSAASTMTNQNSWIEAMKEEWKKPEYKDMPLVATVYGDDQDDKSYREMQGLVKAHPNLKGVISPTTIGIRSGAKAIVDGGLIGKVFITGLGLPSEMKDYVLKGACDTFAIWNPVEYGYSSTYIMNDILNGKPTAEGSKLSMGKKGETTVGKDGECIMGEPFVFDKTNVEKFAQIF